MLTESNKSEISSKHNLGVIEGIITKGVLKGEPFKIRLGPTPSECQMIAGGHVLLCTKASITIDVEKPVTEIAFNCWLLPEEE